MRTGTIYGLICPIENRIVYIGQTAISLKNRLAVHKSLGKKPKRKSKREIWLNNLHTQGILKNLSIISIEENIPLSKLTEAENKWIELYKLMGELYNSDKVNSMARPLGDTGHTRAYRSFIGPQQVDRIKKYADKVGIKEYAKRVGVGSQNIEIAINEFKATEHVLKALNSVFEKQVYNQKAAA